MFLYFWVPNFGTLVVRNTDEILVCMFVYNLVTPQLNIQTAILISANPTIILNNLHY